MAIVRGDKREQTKVSIGEIRHSLADLLLRVDVIQAELDDLEYALGLANEAEQEGREKYAVMHFTAGAEEGHSVEGCVERGCTEKDAEEVEEALAEEKTENSEPELAP